MNLDPKLNNNRVKRIIQAWQQETDRPLSKALGSGKPENKTVPVNNNPLRENSLRKLADGVRQFSLDTGLGQTTIGEIAGKSCLLLPPDENTPPKRVF